MDLIASGLIPIAICENSNELSDSTKEDSAAP
jgi:hypothetical protein